ncbi:WbqC-like protein family protein [Formosa sp. Hel1_31_208]|uniref:WbqC family protein n=1 Tax=Formosa sp. Hel1_31_208 TaxID=1798225 RepID=UPI00087AD3D9|nr:WbqC family protein [Formosa sp. Hel1_31_208]SDS31866.1 WbqC-like protein family protein [Formosa sp. Hel1_31_208]
MDVLLHPTYFPSIAHFVAMLQADHIVFEVCDNYQKQTYRNRCSIYAANGKLDLNVPVVYSQKNRQNSSEVAIFNTDNWQLQHLKSLESAYRTSPFFEFYIDDLMPLFEIKTHSIMEFNLKCIALIFDCLQLPFTYSKTTKFELEPKTIKDARGLANSRKEIQQHFSNYAQVFDEKYGFLTNLSILDLLFNEGPNTELYLESQTLIL